MVLQMIVEVGLVLGVIEAMTATSPQLFIAAFGQAHSGELYLVDLISGKLHKLIAILDPGGRP